MAQDTQSLMEIIKEHLTLEELQLWVFPGIAREAQEMLSRPEYSIDHLARLILKDQALAGQILRIANSAFFSGLKKVSTLRDAIIRLGVKQILNCVVMATQKGLYQSGNQVINDYMQSLWQHALSCALGTRWLLERIGYREFMQEGFLAGLFHDIGKLFLLNVLDRIRASGRMDVDMSRSFVSEVLDSMHSECGYTLLKQWNLPETYCDIARRHHDEEFDGNDVLLVVVRLVNQGCRKLGLGLVHDSAVVLAGSAEAHALAAKEVQLAELEIMLEDSASANF